MRNRKGFTLIETSDRGRHHRHSWRDRDSEVREHEDKAFVAAMKSDLRNMATYEEQYAADNGGAYSGCVATQRTRFRASSRRRTSPGNRDRLPGPPPSWSAVRHTFAVSEAYAA